MNIFVTGASGFLGTTLCRFLKANGHQVLGVSSKECNLEEASSLSKYDGERFDHIYHLAVWTQAGDFCVYHPAEQWVINQKINTNMLDWWQKKQPQAKMITMGTSCAYDPNYPLDEDHFLSGTPIESLEAYGMTKRMLLSGLRSMQKQYGLNYLFLIPSTLYGIDGYHTDGKQLHFIFDLIRKILRGKHFGETVTLWGNGEQKRELVHVNDFVETMVHLASNTSNEALNLGAGGEYSIKEFAQMICEEAGYPMKNIQFDTKRYVGALSKVLLISKLQKILPSYTTRPPQEGIREIVQWLENNKELLVAP